MQFYVKIGSMALILAILFMPTEAISQQTQDVVYLKSGSILRGTIIEQIPGEIIKIRTRDGNIFVYPMEQVHRIAREPTAGRIKRKSPGTALAISLIGGLLIDGMGQFYNGDPGKGLGFAAWSLLGQFVILAGSEDNDSYWGDVDNDDSLIVVGLISRLGSYVISAMDAYRSAKIKNEESYQRFGRYRPRSNPSIDFGLGRRGEMFVSLRHTF